MGVRFLGCILSDRRSVALGEGLSRIYDESGIDAVRMRLDLVRLSGFRKANALIGEAFKCSVSARRKATDLGAIAQSICQDPIVRKRVGFLLWKTGAIERPLEILESLDSGIFSPEDAKRLVDMREDYDFWRSGFFVVPDGVGPGKQRVPNRWMYVASQSYPLHTNGYTIRSDEIVSTLREMGVPVDAVTRPGYPWDRGGSTFVVGNNQPSDPWIHLSHPSTVVSMRRYFEEGSAALDRLMRDRASTGVWAASDAESAMPALLAARKNGLFFVYEMRGLWEWSNASNDPDYAETERFRMKMDMERRVARASDRVMVISRALAAEVASWGVDPSRIMVLPNCIRSCPEVKRKLFKPSDGLILGYAGSSAAYEGLDDLLRVLALVRDTSRLVRLRLWIDARAKSGLLPVVEVLGLTGSVEFRDRCLPDRMPDELSAVDAVVLPRRDTPVTRIIPPLKLVQAMALGLPVVAPRLPVICEEVIDGETGLLFDPGSSASLQDRICQLHDTPDLAVRLGLNAHRQVLNSRLWRSFLTDCFLLMNDRTDDE